MICPRPPHWEQVRRTREKRLLINHFAAAAAHGTCDQSVFGLGALPLTASAFFQARNLNVDRDPAHGILEADFEIVANIVAASARGCAAAGSAASEHIAEPEHVAQDVAEIRESRTRRIRCRPPPLATP